MGAFAEKTAFFMGRKLAKARFSLWGSFFFFFFCFVFGMTEVDRGTSSRLFLWKGHMDGTAGRIGRKWDVMHALRAFGHKGAKVGKGEKGPPLYLYLVVGCILMCGWGLKFFSDPP
ncbi:hypothetical protein F5X96DRAFT_80125 [Biscogniauxia mediterranea]|nr:hypothetical protein F5X96DRAFT_80125 [Biscogniauxia mediterranea]